MTYNTNTFWLGLGLIIVTGIAILFILLYANASISKLNPSQCASNTGPYGVRANRGGTNIKTINGVSLYDAIVACDTDSSCTVFSYNSQARIMYVLDPNEPIYESQTTDVYSKR